MDLQTQLYQVEVLFAMMVQQLKLFLHMMVLYHGIYSILMKQILFSKLIFKQQTIVFLLHLREIIKFSMYKILMIVFLIFQAQQLSI